MASMVGPKARHGGHHWAQKSTSTGLSELRTSVSKLESVNCCTFGLDIHSPSGRLLNCIRVFDLERFFDSGRSSRGGAESQREKRLIPGSSPLPRALARASSKP